MQCREDLRQGWSTVFAMPSRTRIRAFEDIAAAVKLHTDVSWLYVELNVLMDDAG